MTKQAVAALPEFKRLQGVLAGLSTELHVIQAVHNLHHDDLGLFLRPESLYDMVLDHASDVMTQRELLSKLSADERMMVRML